ncbi:hypothetical protein CLPU_12c00200 [Gottschalkia purinilytica]|uniref:Uncharacterized protein n=1 Tax=Gottschalkia purinilytica TaxID=1503 RepID=A0A0L0W8H3_GOTPU|nr:hypothetical protein [Gottschalkia purinilytica]KNF07747.1 hypothetical protein CLPU_12c00200 [Gottschalkia purinilytica]
MKESISLRILDKFEYLFEKMGVNYKIMRSILKVKFAMDERRVPVNMNGMYDKDKKSLFAKPMVSYGVIGIIVGLLTIIPAPLFVNMNMIIGMIMFMVTMSLISDFSSVLLDVKSKNILMSKPIDLKTINTAKIIHIIAYLFTMVVAISGIALIIGTIKHGVLFFIILSLELILVSLFIIFLTSFLYSVLLKYFDGEKLKDIINYFQIFFSIVLIVGYQFAVRAAQFLNIDSTATLKWWKFFIPSMWFAAPFEIFINNNYKALYIYLTIVAILVPVICIILYIKIVSPYFEKNLSKLNNNKGTKNNFIEKKQKLQMFISKLICQNKTERTFFRFAQNIISRERKLKLKIYPSLAIAVILPFITTSNYFTDVKSISEVIKEISNSNLYFYIYFTIAMISTSTMIISLSENYKGSWIYKALPIESIEYVHKGAIKGLILKYLVPIYVVIAGIFLVIYKGKIILDIIVMFLVMILFTLFAYKRADIELPFSEDVDQVQKQAGSTTIINMIIGGVLALLHYILLKIKFGLIIYTGILVIIIMLFWKKSFIPQKKIYN